MPRGHAVSAKAESIDLSATPNKIGAIILAAGRSSRMGTVNKLLEPVAGKEMMRHAIDAAIGSSASSVIVVTGFDADKIEESLEGLPVRLVHNRRYSQGMSTSLRCGIEALPDDVDGVVICLADMPDVNSGHIDKLIENFDPDMERAICVSCFNGRRGNPVLWSRFFFAEMKKLTGDQGARKLLCDYRNVIFEVVMPSDAVLRDIDTPEALAEMTQ